MKTNKQENWPAPLPLARLNPKREEVAKQTEEFLKNGGKIEKYPPEVSRFNKLFSRSGPKTLCPRGRHGSMDAK